MTTSQDKARTLADLHRAPEILRVVNVWDAVSAATVAALPETRALATAGHSIAATFGYPDGENIPRDLMLDMVARIVETAGALPVSADLDAGFGGDIVYGRGLITAAAEQFQPGPGNPIHRVLPLALAQPGSFRSVHDNAP